MSIKSEKFKEKEKGDKPHMHKASHLLALTTGTWKTD